MNEPIAVNPTNLIIVNPPMRKVVDLSESKREHAEDVAKELGGWLGEQGFQVEHQGKVLMSNGPPTEIKNRLEGFFGHGGNVSFNDDKTLTDFPEEFDKNWGVESNPPPYKCPNDGQMLVPLGYECPKCGYTRGEKNPAFRFPKAKGIVEQVMAGQIGVGLSQVPPEELMPSEGRRPHPPHNPEEEPLAHKNPKWGKSDVQSILFDKKRWTVADAKDWLKKHDYKFGDVDEKTNVLRFRQIDPSKIKKGRYAIIPFGKLKKTPVGGFTVRDVSTGIMATIGDPKANPPKQPPLPRIFETEEIKGVEVAVFEVDPEYPQEAIGNALRQYIESRKGLDLIELDDIDPDYGGIKIIAYPRPGWANTRGAYSLAHFLLDIDDWLEQKQKELEELKVIKGLAESHYGELQEYVDVVDRDIRARSNPPKVNEMTEEEQNGIAIELPEPEDNPGLLPAKHNSTRANILLIDDDTAEERKNGLWLYQHSDGYPEGVLPTLREFVSWVKEGRIRDDAMQAVNWLILLSMRDRLRDLRQYHEQKQKDKEGSSWYADYAELYEKRIDNFFYPPFKDAEKGMQWKVAFIEPTPYGQHGDIEWLYVVNLKDRTIEINDVYDKKKWKDDGKSDKGKPEKKKNPQPDGLMLWWIAETTGAPFSQVKDEWENHFTQAEKDAWTRRYQEKANQNPRGYDQILKFIANDVRTICYVLLRSPAHDEHDKQRVSRELQMRVNGLHASLTDEERKTLNATYPNIGKLAMGEDYNAKGAEKEAEKIVEKKNPPEEEPKPEVHEHTLKFLGRCNPGNKKLFQCVECQKKFTRD